MPPLTAAKQLTVVSCKTDIFDLCELDSIALLFDWAFVLAASQELPEEEEVADVLAASQELPEEEEEEEEEEEVADQAGLYWGMVMPAGWEVGNIKV